LRRSSDPVSRKWTYVILSGILMPLLGGVVTNMVLPMMGTTQTPQMAVPLTALNSMIIGLGMLRYRLFIISPEQTARTVVDTMTEGLFLADPSGAISFVNPSVTKMLDRDATALRGIDLTLIIQPAHELELALRRALQGETVSGEGSVTGPAGKRVPVEYTLRAVRRGPALEPQGIVCVVRDVGPLKALINQLEDTSKMLETQAVTDVLTGVRNRRYMDARLAEELATAQRHRVPFTVIMLDIDHFKTINDSLGHDVGDQALRGVAQALQDGLRASDVITRYGGDEFVILLPETGAERGLEIAERLREGIRQTTLPGGKGVTASLGVLTYSGDDSFDSSDALLRAVDRSLLQSKEAGRDRVRVVGVRSSETILN